MGKVRIDDIEIPAEDDFNEATAIALSETLIDRISEYFSNKEDIITINSAESVLPMTSSLCVALLFRILDLSDCSLGLFKANRKPPAFTLLRSALETAALIYSIGSRTNDVCVTKNLNEYRDYIVKCLLGSRNESTPVDSLNVLTCVDKVDKEFNGFKTVYDFLCEYAHPNCAGTSRNYGKIDPESGRVVFTLMDGGDDKIKGLRALYFVLAVACDEYNKICDKYPELDKLNFSN